MGDSDDNQVQLQNINLACLSEVNGNFEASAFEDCASFVTANVKTNAYLLALKEGSGYVFFQCKKVKCTYKRSGPIGHFYILFLMSNN